ncbi:MAG: glycosyltransferase [Gammaproteobacteria bacterium]|nr:MAG: glycosyltransferase [Gammaproteobacteria bacterium]
MKWGDKYGSDYVNRLYNMVNRNLTLPFDMVCLTDRREGVNPAVQCYDIPPLDLPAGSPERGWNKLSTFESDLHGLQGQALFLDLDVVITDNIDCFFTYRPEKQFLVIHDWKRPWRITGNTSVYRFQLGAFPKVLPYFRDNFEQIRNDFRNEQAFLCDFLKKEYATLDYWPTDWCRSYKYHCLKSLPWAWWQAPACPKDAKIIIFHGEVNPPDAITGGGGKWYRHILPAPWIAEYWR